MLLQNLFELIMLNRLLGGCHQHIAIRFLENQKPAVHVLQQLSKARRDYQNENDFRLSAWRDFFVL